MRKMKNPADATRKPPVDAEPRKPFGAITLADSARNDIDTPKKNPFIALDGYAQRLRASECYGDPVEEKLSESEILDAIKGADKGNGFIRGYLAAIAALTPFASVQEAAQKALDETPLVSIVEAIKAPHTDEELMETVRGILEKDPSRVNERDENQKTPLMLAANYGSPELVGLLIGYGAEIDTSDGCGKTALSYACASARIENARLLIVAGADVNARSIMGHTILTSTYVFYDDKSEIVKLLKAHGAEGEYPRFF